VYIDKDSVPFASAKQILVAAALHSFGLELGSTNPTRLVTCPLEKFSIFLTISASNALYYTYKYVSSTPIIIINAASQYNIQFT
jgi:hypothetical protein